MKIFLIGMPGCGKSTAGKMLADYLGWEFVDMDMEVEKATGKSIAAIFEEEGEKHFRFLEKQLLQMLVNKDSIVVATGGGVPVHSNNMQIINDSGLSIYLKSTVSQLAGNIGNDTEKRPLLKGGNPEAVLKKLLEEREQLYSTAHHTIHSLSPEATVNEIINILRK